MKTLKIILFCATLFIAALGLAGCATVSGVNEEPQQPPTIFPTFPYDQYVEGKPNIDPRVSGGVFIWRTGNTWSVRVAEKANKPRMLTPNWPIITGSIVVENAVLANVQNQTVTQLDFVRAGREKVQFRFELLEPMANQVKGFDFRVQPIAIDYCMTIEVNLDGVSRPGLVRLGSFMHVPESLPLRFCLRGHR